MKVEESSWACRAFELSGWDGPSSACDMKSSDHRPTLNLFETARANTAIATEMFNQLAAQISEEQDLLLRDFTAWVDAQGLLSINVGLLVAVELVNGKKHQNIYEWADEQAELSARPRETILRERLRDFYDRRVTFDSALDDGESMRYGALNAGGVGATAYAPYCLLLSRTLQENIEQLAFLPGDSLKICFDSDGHFAPALLKTLVTPPACRSFLVARERIKEILNSEPAVWPSLVISHDRFFEAIFIADVSVEAIDSIRVSQVEYDRIWDLAFANFGRKLGDAERALVHDFVQLKRAVVDRKIKLEVCQ